LRLLDTLGLPVFQVNGMQVAGPTVFGMMIWFFYLRFTIPVLGVFYGTSLIADEVEDKTITYLFTRPVRRGPCCWEVPGLLACTSSSCCPSVSSSTLSIVPMRGSLGGSFLDLLKDLRSWPSAWRSTGRCSPSSAPGSSGPLLVGLIFIFGWEQMAPGVPGLPQEVHGRLLPPGLVPHAMPNDTCVSLIQGFFRETPSLPRASSGCA
jgi:hypothetical protein